MKRVIRVDTQEQYDELMLLLEKQGYAWSTESNVFGSYSPLCINLNDEVLKKQISYASLDFYRRLCYEIIPFDDYMTKHLNLKLIKLMAILSCKQ